MATGDRAFSAAKVKLEIAKTELKELMEDEETTLIATAVEQVEKTWTEFDNQFSLKISEGNSEDSQEVQKHVKSKREKDKMISEARKMMEANAKSGSKNGRRRNQRASRVKWSDISNQEVNLSPGKGSNSYIFSLIGSLMCLFFQPHHGLFCWALREQARAPLATPFLARMSLKSVTSQLHAQRRQRSKRDVCVEMVLSLS